MPLFYKLPSGLIINLALVRRVEASEQQGQAALRVYFAEGDFTILDATDSDVLAKRLGSGQGLSPNVRTALFWIVLLLAVLLVWMAVRTRV